MICSIGVMLYIDQQYLCVNMITNIDFFVILVASYDNKSFFSSESFSVVSGFNIKVIYIQAISYLKLQVNI